MACGSVQAGGLNLEAVGEASTAPGPVCLRPEGRPDVTLWPQDGSRTSSARNAA